ncbi:interferon-induced protein with tetratricopeptide repeats 1-like isoform X2 [Prionailurus viverrinus]|uniref:interferon-induced protein with tetratricopeptide repeats 1-like isoform X1 n=2 Tax=Prionailurus viverrinus TaxID=61388 RepID=UPI001FF438A5|nr:interferon-induced protein with tetratricopeptide repeats 1-like isoform X1 [Prionailurus viverrinus]XP_047680567.1 interferon-induced protein with tetratricopeptide repeats 1-like isoform X2 [Prionailurus viverrinus]
MSKNADEVKGKLLQLRCHFTWELLVEDTEMPDLENRILDEIEFLDTKYNAGIHNLLAYVRHLKGQTREALGSLKEAEDLIQQEHGDRSAVRSLVTWGNYAWLYHHTGRLAEAQTYLDRVANTCEKFAAPSCYRLDCPQMDCEEGWALLKCGGKNYERAKACFEKALAAEPENPEFSTGYAITIYRLDGFNKATQVSDAFCLQPLKEAIRLNPEDAYIKALLALKLQDVGQEAEGEKYVEEALTNMSSQAYVFRYAAKFYRRKGALDNALQLLKRALRATPSSAFLHHQMGLCYKAHMIQIKRAANWQPRGQDRDNVDKMVRLAIAHFQFALEQKPTFDVAYIHLAGMYIEAGNHRKAEDIYQKLLCLTSLDEEKQQKVHFHYGQFQEFQKKSEVNAIIHYLKALKTEKVSLTRDKCINSLEKLTLRRLSRNASDIESLSILGFIYKVKGEMNKALEYYEQALRLAVDSGNSGT